MRKTIKIDKAEHLEGPYPIPEAERGRPGLSTPWPNATPRPAFEYQDWGTPTPGFVADSPATVAITGGGDNGLCAPLQLHAPAPVVEDRGNPPGPRIAPHLVTYGDAAGFEAACRKVCELDGGEPDKTVIFAGESSRTELPLWKMYSILVSSILSAYDEAAAAAPPQPIPEGFALLPLTPTAAMIDKGAYTESEWWNDDAPIGQTRYNESAAAIYKAMAEDFLSTPAADAPRS